MIVTPLARRRVHELALSLEAAGSLPADPEVFTLRTVAESLRGHRLAPPGPRQEFRDSLREHLLAVAALTPVGQARRRHAIARPAASAALRRRLSAGGAGLIIVGSGVSGIAVASSEALPGEMLYGVKRTVEDIRMSLSLSDAAKGKRHLAEAATRMREVETLLAANVGRTGNPAVTERLDGAFADLRDSAAAASELIIGSYESDREVAGLTDIRRFTAEHRERLRAIQAALPLALRDESVALSGLFDQIDRRVDQVMGLSVPRAPGEGASGNAPNAPGVIPAPAATATPTAPPTDSSASPEPSPTSTDSSDGLLPGLPGTDPSTPLPGTGEDDGVRVDLPPILPGVDPSVEINVPPLLPGLPGAEVGVD